MDNLYYIRYVLELDDSTVYGELYAVNTGYGILELGLIERDKIYMETYLSKSPTIEDYLTNSSNKVVDFVRVL
jgi:hypothetical protein